MATSRIVSRFQTGNYAVTRHSAGAYVDGRWAAAAATNLNVAGVVQPVTGKDLQLLPEGTAISDSRKVWTTTELLPSDAITIGGKVYNVISVMPWEGRNGDDHFECIVAKELRQ